MIKRIYNKWGFTLLIILISTLIFQLSSSWSEDFRPKSRQQQEFVEATVTHSISNHVMPDPLVPDVMTGKQVFMAKILEGESEGLEVEVTNPLSRQHNVYVSEGDTFIMMIRETSNGTVYWAYNHKRSDAIYLMLALFCALLLSFGKKEGINSMVALYFTAALIVGVLVPSIFAGWNPMLISILLMMVIIVVSFILVSGYNRKSLCAMGGDAIGRDSSRCNGAVVWRNGTLVGYLSRQRRRRDLPNFNEDGYSLVDVRDDCGGCTWGSYGCCDFDCIGVCGAAANRPETDAKAAS